MRYNVNQSSFITHAQKHIRLIAPPGTGKTQVCAARIIHLANVGVNLKRVLATTFNVDAAKELRGRLVESGMTQLPIIRNYHKVASRMNRTFIEKGLLNDAQLITNDWRIRGKAKEALQHIVGHSSQQGLNADDPAVVEEFAAFIGFSKSDIQTPEVMFKRLGLTAEYTPFIEAFSVYEENRKIEKFQTFSLCQDSCIVQYID